MLKSLRLVAILAIPMFSSLPGAHGEDYPSPPREFRASWVATVGRINWPSKDENRPEEQKKAMLAILDRHVELNLNAMVFQIRPACDALYASKLEPWSSYLTGTLGKAPEPYYDPLEFTIKEAHARGIEVHAWFNPYRAGVGQLDMAKVPANSILKTRPDLVKRYGTYYWLNPTHPDVMKHSLAVVNDVVRRYDVDGIHMDDYYYPYPIKREEVEVDFPDDDTWKAYQESGGKLARDDWRRDAVNRFVKQMYDETKAVKPWVKVGLSPFGIWRPGNPPGIEGFDQYAKQYADAKLWFNEGWVDYFTPQLYWPIKREKQSYPRLLAWWADQNLKGRHFWPGNNVNSGGQRRNQKAKTEEPNPHELRDQIKVTRAQKGAGGNVLWSFGSLRNPTVSSDLKELYADQALVPACPWLGSEPPAKPQVELKAEADKQAVSIQPQGEKVHLYVVRTFADGKWATRIVPADGINAVKVSLDKKPERIVVTAVSRVGIESPAVTLN